jgi:DNA-binding transcriptional regulator YdaS (Cro superfamily)
VEDKTTPMGVVVPRGNNYAIYNQLSLICHHDLLGIALVGSGVERLLMKGFELFGTDFGQGDTGQQNRGTPRTFTDDIDAIAYGVAAWLEENSGYSTNVTGMTVEIARKLGVPEKEINKWAARRSSLNARRVKPIRVLMQRLCSEPATEELRKLSRTKEVQPP